MEANFSTKQLDLCCVSHLVSDSGLGSPTLSPMLRLGSEGACRRPPRGVGGRLVLSIISIAL